MDAATIKAGEKLRDEVADIRHFFSSGVYAKQSRIPAGYILVPHAHTFDHLSILASGQAIVKVEGEAEKVVVGPHTLEIKQGLKHTITALTDVTWYCIHATTETDPAKVDEVLVQKPTHIARIGENAFVRDLAWALKGAPHLWNQRTGRTAPADSPHRDIDDIWVRFSESDEGFFSPHKSVWCPAAEELPSVKQLCSWLLSYVGGDELGGVLITRVPPGKRVHPHEDHGWHAEYYQKIAVQIASAPGQKFCFEGEELETKPGDIYWFSNQSEHWVENPTDQDRITLIACIRTDFRPRGV